MEHTYKKRFLDAEGTYQIEYWYEDQLNQIINEDKPTYVEWLDEGNEPEVIPYVPPVPPTPTVEEKRATVIEMIQQKQRAAYSSGFIFEGNTYPSDSLHREIMYTGARLGQKAIDAGQTITKPAVTTDGSLVSLDQDQLVALLSAYDDHVEPAYDLYTSEIVEVQTAEESALDYYIEHGEFE